MRARVMAIAALAAAAVICGLAADGERSTAGDMWPPRGPTFHPVACGVGGNVALRWYIDEGVPPYTASIEGFDAMTVDEARVEVPCADIRAQFLDGDPKNHVQVELAVHVVDANGREGRADSASLLLLAPAPRHTPPTVEEFIVGYTDMHVRFNRWRYRYPMDRGHRQDDELVSAIAIVRYRPIDGSDWRYSTPYPGRSQNSRGYTPAHAADLEPDTEYEAQLAWVWYVSTPGQSAYHIGGLRRHWRIDFDWLREQGVDRWWRDWNDADALRWSTSQRFHTLDSDLAPVATATADMISVSWAGHSHGYIVSARSPDWPGVIWFSRDNPHPPLRDDGLRSAVLGGLPPDTEFEVQVEPTYVYGFTDPPPARINVRTAPDGPELEPGAADPNDVFIELSGRRLRVEWTEQDSVRTVLRARTGGTPGESVRGWHSGQPANLHAGGRVGVTWQDLPADSSLQLYLNREPDWDNKTDSYMCAIWDVRTPTENVEAYLDRHMYSAYGERNEFVVAGRVPDDYTDLWWHCTLWLSIGP